MDEPIENIEPQTVEFKAPAPKPKAGSIPKRTMTSSTAKPKLSTSSSFRTPSAPAVRTTNGTTLNKPPTRPTVGSTLKKPTANSKNAISGNKPPITVSSVDEDTRSAASGGEKQSTPGLALSGDEKQPKPGLGAPKRLSTVGSNTSSKLGPERMPVAHPTGISERKAAGRTSAASPLKTARPPSAGPQPTTKSSISSSRPVGAGVLKVRPTIIPASTANKQKVKSEYEKENDQESAPENPRGKGLTRPPLVTRQSTRSAAIQQRIREYELVNEMLQAAMAAEDAGDETETENLTTEVEEAITHLKTNLEVPGEASTAEKPTILIGSTESTSILEGQLQESKVTIEKLGHEVEELRTQVAAAKIPVDWPGSSESTIESTSAAHTAEMKEIKKQHELEIASLRQKLQVLELSEQERAEQAALFSNHSKAVEALQNDLALERKAMKESADKVSLLVHEIEDRKAEIATANAKAEQHVKNIQAYQVQLASKDRELQGQGVVIRNLEEEVTALQQAKSAEAETLKQSFTKRVVELEEHIATLKSAADRSSEESAVSNAHVQEKMICQEKEISRLGQVIERLQDEIQKVHETKSNELDERLLQIRQEHDQTVEALKAEHQLSIDGLTSSHNTIVEKLDFEARNNRTAYEKQIQVLENERSEVQKRLKDTNNLLKTSQDEAEKRIHELESKHEKSLQAANESLATAEKALANSQQLLKQTKEDSERTVATTIKTLEDKVQALEGQAAGDAAAIKSSREDLAAAQEQVVSLKHTLMTMEKDSHSKEDHHAESLKKALDQAEMARKSLLERSKSPELAEKSHAEAIENLKSGHEAELEMVRSELSQKHENLFLDLKGKHDELLAAHANLERSQKHELERLKAEHDRALGDSSKMIADLQRAHFGELEEVRRQISDDHSRALKQLEEEFSKKVTDAEKMHKAALDDLRSSHEKTLLDLRAELEDSHLKSAETTKKSHEAIVKDLKICLEKQKTELAAAQSELRKTSDQARNPQLDVVRSQLHESTDALTAARSEISRLAHEVEAMKQRFEQGQKTIHELESAAKKISKARMDSSSQEVQALREQLDGALQEAETQRTNSDIANKELRERTEEAKQFQTRIEELEAKLYVGNKELVLDPKVTTPGSLRKRNRKRPKMMSPRLSQSEWTSEVADGGISGNPSPRTHGENLGSSIQGTMASIKEQIRQLDEVNEDMLEGHARMASMLSSVSGSPIHSPPPPAAAI